MVIEQKEKTKKPEKQTRITIDLSKMYCKTITPEQMERDFVNFYFGWDVPC